MLDAQARSSLEGMSMAGTCRDRSEKVLHGGGAPVGVVIVGLYMENGKEDGNHYLGFLGLGVWGFPKIRATFLGVPIIRVIAFWGPYWGPPFFGKLPYSGCGAVLAKYCNCFCVVTKSRVSDVIIFITHMAMTAGETAADARPTKRILRLDPTNSIARITIIEQTMG